MKCLISVHLKQHYSHYQNGDLKIVDGETHNGIRHNQETMLTIKSWLDEQGLLAKN